ncbi:MAG: DNA-3-methyladenine glycosylase [Candidatus Sumerlaeaceae bacterium]
MTRTPKALMGHKSAHLHPTPPPDLSLRFPQAFYERSTLQVCRDLLGAYLVHNTTAGPVGGRVVEAEAYLGPADQGAHSAAGRRTQRNEVMYGARGRAYVFIIYGMYWCFNVVTGAGQRPQAILIRALEPSLGIDLMKDNLSAPAHVALSTLCRGPGKLCKALGITRDYNSEDLSGNRLFLVPGKRLPAALVGRSPRINIDYAGDWIDKPWRMYERGNPCVSGPPRLRV